MPILAKKLPSALLITALLAQAPLAQAGEYACISSTGEQKWTLPANVFLRGEKRFSSGLTVISDLDDDNREGFINKEGKRLKFSSNYVYPFSEGLAAAEKDGRFGYIDKSGRFVIKPQFKWAYSFREGRAKVMPAFVLDKYIWSNSSRNLDGKLAFINRNGSFASGLLVDEASAYSEGAAAVLINGRIGFIDKDGNFLVKPHFQYTTGFSEGLALIWEIGKKLSFIDKEGKTAIELDLVPNQSLFVCRDLKFGKLQLDEDISLGTIKVRYRYPLFSPSLFKEGLAPLVKDKRFGYIDKTGTFIIPPQYDFAFPFSEGLAVIVDDGKYGYIDRSGKVVISPSFYEAGNFNEGLAPVQTENQKWGYINKTGQFVIEPKYKAAYPFSEGLAFVEQAPVAPNEEREPPLERLRPTLPVRHFYDSTGNWFVPEWDIDAAYRTKLLP
ncbi:MAG: WG repeat-containing protein [Candidatus Obscuribacterales bacterium]|nr:WG repeat-containing protein [Candidatus Obscuribacterales bacterium]